MIYLYAITEPDASAPACRGLDDAPLEFVAVAEVAGLYSSHEWIEPRPQPESLWRHEEVVEAALGGGAALPARFGTTFADARSLAAALEPHAQTLREQLERLRGCVELAVRVGFPEAEQTVPASGRAYLETKLSRKRRNEAVVAETLAPLSELATCARTNEGRSAGEDICASYLVPRGWVEPFVEKVRTLAENSPQLALSCTGPWPPYSFVELEPPA